MRRKIYNGPIKQLAFSFEETGSETLQESSRSMDMVSPIGLIEQEERDQALEYNREKAIARFMQIGDDLGLNDNYWKTSWRSHSDEQLQTSLAIWEQYYEDVRNGRKIRPIHSKIGERTR